MSTTSIPSARARAKTRVSYARFRAWLVASATRPEARLWLVIQLAILHAVLWTFILINLKAAQDVHMDVAEAWGWGQKFLWGYGKHPPLSGWVAGLWFTAFPATDWATYALAMATVGTGMVICWLLALRVVDARRAFLVVVMIALYPIFNFKGFKYNPDLLQLVTLPLLVLAYLSAFEKRSWQSGIWLGLAGALALMTKYWVLTMIGAIGLAALIHPDRLRFLLSPAPWVAIATLTVAAGPPLGALVFSVYLKTDWGISLFFLVPLALVAIPALRVQSATLFNITAIWLVLGVATLAASPWIATREMAVNADNTATY